MRASRVPDQCPGEAAAHHRLLRGRTGVPHCCSRHHYCVQQVGQSECTTLGWGCARGWRLETEGGKGRGGWGQKVKGERDAPAVHLSAPMDPCWGSGLPFFPEDGALSVLTLSTLTSCSTIPVATVRTAAPHQAWGSALSSVCVPVHSFLVACGEGSGHLAGQACACVDRRTSVLSRSPTSPL